MEPQRACGLLDDLAGLRPGDHVCWTYASDGDHRRALTTYMLEGLDRGERLVYFSHRYRPETVMGYLVDAGIDAASLVASTQLVIMPAYDAYTPDGTFQPLRMLEQFRQAAEQAAAHGFSGVRAASETEWLVPEFTDPTTLLDFEFRADRLSAGLKMTGLCGYDRRRCDPELLFRIESLHPARNRASVGQPSFGLFSSRTGGLMADGEIDLPGRDAWITALGVASECSPRLSLDMSRVRFIDAASLYLLAEAAARLAAAGGLLTVSSISPTARKCLDLLNLSGMPGLQFAGNESAVI